MTQADVTDALKPCPFCGNDGTGPIEDALHVSFHEAEWRHGDAWSVQCDKCTATMGYSKNKDEAVESWNTRAPDPAARNAALEEAAKVAEERLRPTNPESDWTDYAADRAEAAQQASEAIRALKEKNDE